jgi:hypothetical protein
MQAKFTVAIKSLLVTNSTWSPSSLKYCISQRPIFLISFQAFILHIPKGNQKKHQRLNNQMFSWQPKAHGNAQLTMIWGRLVWKLPSPICCAIAEVSLVRLFGPAKFQLCTFLSNTTRFIQLNFLNLSQKISMRILFRYKVHVRWK